MLAVLTSATAAELSENDTYGGRLDVAVSVGLDTADGDIVTTHDLANVLLACAPDTLRYIGASC